MIASAARPGKTSDEQLQVIAAVISAAGRERLIIMRAWKAAILIAAAGRRIALGRDENAGDATTATLGVHTTACRDQSG